MASISDRNYFNDRRVIAADRSRREQPELDESRMRLTYDVTTEDENGDEVEIEVSLPAKFEVCGTCDGRGSHVNPSIDADGISPEDFAEDPEFAESYFGGAYDQPCNECGGRRVVAVIDESHLNSTQARNLRLVRKAQREQATFEAECRAERAMGC